MTRTPCCLLLALAWVCAGCAAPAPRATVRAPDPAFEKLAADFVATHFAVRPLAAVSLGWHEYDGKVAVPDAASLKAERERLHRFDREFRALPVSTLSPKQRQDLSVLQSVIASELWSMETQRSYWRNPMTYAAGLDVSVYLKRDFKPLDERVHDIASILREAPRYLAVARSNLEQTLPRPFVETAIQSAEGTAMFLERDVIAAAGSVTNAIIRTELAETLFPAVAAFREYAGWLKTNMLPRADVSFALGRKAYVAMLKAEEIDIPPETLLEIGLRELRKEQRRLAEAAAVIDPNLKPLDAAHVIQRDHPTAEGLIPDTRRDLETIRGFVIDHHIVTIPSDVRARVEETLPPFRATSFASMDTPGPFETRATEAYYYVTPVESDWTPAQKQEWLGAFNYYTTDIVTIHEAYPGHYVQFLALNASPATAVEKVFGSYPFVEGWAHYAEQMMIEQGFGQPPDLANVSRDARVRGAKYRIAQSMEALLRLCRLCCSIQLHTRGMTVDEATRFFVENCYYEEKPSRSEAIRGTFDPGYLYYTLGKLMILKLREDWRAQEGSHFTLQRFHDEFLRHGAPPIPVLRRVLLRDPQGWDRLL